MTSPPVATEPGEILTFYSYKGGTGRSMVLANTACLLAQQPEGHGGVLIVDWDLEAPGLHRYFADRFHRRFDNPETATAELEGYPGLIDFFIALAAEIDKLPPILEEPTPEIQQQLSRAVKLESYILPTDVPNVSLIKAGAFDETYAKRVNTFPWEPLYQRAPWVISLVADWFTSRFRYTLIDSRTGITDTSGICTMLLPDKLIAVFTPNQQSLDGVLQMVERSTNYRRRSSDLRPLSVFPLPSRIETSEPDLREKWRKGAGTGYQPKFEALFRKIWELDDCNLDAYFNEVQIQHASAYSYGEKVAVLLEKSNDRTSLRRAYASFVERLALDEPWDAPAASTITPATTGTADIAESVYAQLRPNEQDVAKGLFLQLIRVPQDSPKPAARERELEALTGEAQTAVPTFVGAKVLSLRETDGKKIVFLADETLVSAWRRLSDWIAADLEFLRWRDALDAAKANWDKFGHPKEGLLRGLPLKEAEATRSTRLADLDVSEFEYIKASIKARTRRKILQWTLSIVAGVVTVVGVFVLLRLRDESKTAEARATLYQGGIDAAIRADRLYALPEIDARLRTLLSELPQPVAVLPHSSAAVAGMLFSDDATHLAVNDSDRVTSFSLKPVASPISIPLHQALSVAFSPGGKWLAVGDSEGARKILNLQNGGQYTVPFGKPVTAIAFSPDASKIATGTGNGDIYLSTIPDTKTIHLAHKAPVNALAFNPSGGTLASASTDRTAQLWDAGTGRNFAILEHDTPVVAAVFSPDSKYLATTSSDGILWIWLSKLDAPVLTKFPTPVGSDRMFSLDGRYLIYIGVDDSIRLLDVTTQRVSGFVDFPAHVVSFALASGNSILAACVDGAIYSASLTTKGFERKWLDDRIRTLLPGNVAFSKDGALFAVQSKAGPIVVYSSEAPADKSYQALQGSALADATCQKLKPLAAIDPDYSKGCPAR